MVLQAGGDIEGLLQGGVGGGGGRHPRIIHQVGNLQSVSQFRFLKAVKVFLIFGSAFESDPFSEPGLVNLRPQPQL